MDTAVHLVATRLDVAFKICAVITKFGQMLLLCLWRNDLTFNIVWLSVMFFYCLLFVLTMCYCDIVLQLLMSITGSSEYCTLIAIWSR